MLCPAAVSAAAAAVWLLAVLGPGLSLPAEDNSEPDVSLCTHCFYRQTPPQGASSAGLLCHSLPGGQAFATLSQPTCDTAVFSAFHLSPGWTEKEGEELVTNEEEENIKVAVPALVRGGGDPSHHVSPTDAPLQNWDSTVTTLVQSNISPRCSSLGGDLYILTGVGGLGALEDGDEECQTKPLWSAVCCTVPEGKSGFSMGLIRETGEGEREVSVKELEEILGVAELFSEGCGEADGETVGIRVGLHSEGLPGNIEKLDADLTGDNTGDEDVDSNTAGRATEGEEVGLDATEGQEVGLYATKEEEVGLGATKGEEVSSGATKGEEVGSGATKGEEVGSGATKGEEVGSGATKGEEVGSGATKGEEVGSGATKGEEVGSGATEGIKLRDMTHSRAVRSGSPESSADYETVDEQETDSNSSSTLMYVLSTTLSILKAPLQPVFSTVTKLPGQVTYVLQEDLGVLSALPGETFSLFQLLTSDLLSWTGSAGETLLGIGENCCSSVYYCSSSMLGALLNSCHTGVTGMGTLAGDTVGIFGNAFDNAWWVTKFFGGRLWEQSKGYVGTVASEMGGQVKAVGGGLGRLVWRSVNGVINVFRIGGGLIIGMVDVVFGAAKVAFEQESELKVELKST
ncbi:mucin-22 [Cebidichthys violaceus]|uniref:mucin-22 n=1 Tax=Cebidichthys violaceus TaxID=271503 RepID=UPI0035CB663D